MLRVELKILNKVKEVIKLILEGRRIEGHHEEWIEMDDEEILRKSRSIGAHQEYILEALMSLSYPKPRPEIRYFLEDVYNLTPNISFQPVYNYNYIDFTFKRVKTSRGIVVYVPIVSVNSPELWIGLAHEAGHLYKSLVSTFIKESLKYIDIKIGSVTDDELKNWLEEICCDLFALQTIGPCYYLSFVLLTTLESVYDPFIYYYDVLGVKELEHPHNSVRIEIMKHFIDKHVSDNTFKNLCNKLYDYYTLVKKMEDEFLNELAPGDISKETLDKIEEANSLVSYAKTLDDILTETIKSSNNKFNLVSDEMLYLSYKLANEVISNEVPIGVYRKVDSGEIIKKINELKLHSSNISKEQFNEVFDMLQETPVEIPVLFNTFILVKIKQMNSLHEALFKDNELNSIEAYVRDTAQRSELFLKSIAVSYTHLTLPTTERV